MRLFEVVVGKPEKRRLSAWPYGVLDRQNVVINYVHNDRVRREGKATIGGREARHAKYSVEARELGTWLCERHTMSAIGVIGNLSPIVGEAPRQ
eukprot:COSAG04_NODE_22922_length_347_cov_0.625000_1_plen_93_part_01